MNATTYVESPISVSVDELLNYRRMAQSIGALRKRLVSSEYNGSMQSRMLGRGLDFSELREYQGGDDIRQIDWNVTARTGKPYTKLYAIERERAYFAVVDLRAGMKFATQCAYKSVVASRLAALLCWSAVSANDRVGGLVFTDNRHIEIKPTGGRRGLINLFRAIVELHEEEQQGRGNPDMLVDSVARLARLSHTGSTIWFFSDFSGYDQRVQSHFSSLMRHNEVNAIHMLDKLEADLPAPGVYRIRSDDKSVLLDTHSKITRANYKKRFINRCEELKHRFSISRHFYKGVFTHSRLDKCAVDILYHKRGDSPGAVDES